MVICVMILVGCSFVLLDCGETYEASIIMVISSIERNFKGFHGHRKHNCYGIISFG